MPKLASLSTQEIPPAAAAGIDVFISYSRKDVVAAMRLRDALEEQGKDVWLDVDDIPAAADWHHRIGRGIESARAFVYVLSPDSLTSAHCKREVDLAVVGGKRIVPVVSRDVDPVNVRAEVAGLNWIFARDGEFNSAVAKVVEALETDLEWLDEHRRLLLRANEWAHGGRDRSFLLAGTDLEAFETWLGAQATHRESATPLQTEYVLASRAAATKRQRLTLVAVAAALAVSLGLSAVALVQRSNAIAESHIARSRELATVALSQMSVDPERSLILADEAAKTAPTPEAEAVLREALVASHVRKTLAFGKNWAFSVAVGRDGARVGGVDADGHVQVWDVETGKRLAVLGRNCLPEAGVTFSADGTRLACLVVTGPLAFHIWSVATGRREAVLETVDEFRIAFSRDGDRAVTFSSDDGGAHVWDLRAVRVAAQVRDEQFWIAVDFSPDGKRFVAATDDGVRLWDPSTGTALRKLDSRRGAATSTRFSPDGARVAIVEEEGAVRILHVAGREKTITLAEPRRAGGDVVFSHDGHRVVTIGNDGSAIVSDAETGKTVSTFRTAGEAVAAAAFRRDGTHVVTASADAVRVWQVAPVSFDLDLRGRPKRTGAFAAFSPDQRLVAVAQRAEPFDVDDRVGVWDLATGRRIAVLRTDSSLSAASFSPDGNRLVTTDSDGIARIRVLPSGQVTAVLKGPSDAVRVASASFTDDGKHVVIALTTPAGVQVRDAATGATSSNVQLDPDAAYAGTHLSEVFGPDGVTVASHSGTGRIVEPRKGRTLTELHGNVQDVALAAYSADRALVATADLNGRVDVWRVATGESIASFRSLNSAIPSDAVHGIGFSPDGRLVVTASYGAARLWDVTTEKMIGVFELNPAVDVLSAFISPHGDRVVMVGGDYRVHVVPCDFCGTRDQLLAVARAHMTRDPTKEERQRYLHER